MSEYRELIFSPPKNIGGIFLEPTEIESLDKMKLKKNWTERVKDFEARTFKEKEKHY